MNTQSKIVQALHSKTVWTLVIGLIFNVLVPQLNISPALRDFVNALIVFIAGYFHINPTIQGMYTPAGVPAPATPPVITPQSVLVTPTPPVLP